MPQKKQPKTSRSPPPKTDAPHAESSPRSPFEESLGLWTRFSRQTGETVTEYLRRFGEEQQKNYEAWATTVRDAARPSAHDKELEAARARFEEWNHRAEQIGETVREAFQKTLAPQRELLELWVKPFLPTEASAEDRSRETMELIQKLWSGLSTDVSRRMFSALQPGASVDELVKAQEASMKEFTDSFQKLAQVYFTSPAFVTLFGKNLDASLDRQNLWSAQEDLFTRMTGLPSRREITELSEAVRDLSDKVTRISPGRP